jgi:hypothetical protein
MTPRPSTAAPILAVLAIVLAMMAVYVVAYFVLVRRSEKPFDFVIVNRKPMYAPEYRIGGQLSSIVFMPAYHMDATLRPNYWGRRAADPYDVEVFP